MSMAMDEAKVILRNARIQVVSVDQKAWRFLNDAGNYLDKIEPPTNPNEEFWKEYQKEEF